MAAITSAVVAAVATGVSIHQGEQAAEQSRQAGQAADRQKAEMEGKKKQQKAVKKAEAARDTSYAKQQGGGAEDKAAGGDTLVTGGGGSAVDASAPVTKIGATKSGKTLLGV